jgi:hypothetical protein
MACWSLTLNRKKVRRQWSSEEAVEQWSLEGEG